MLKKWNLLSIYTRTVLTMAAALIGYGYLCRGLHLYFFWESLPIGWEVLLAGGILALLEIIKIRKKEGSKATPLKIGVGLLCFVAVIQLVMSIAILNSDSWIATKEHLRNDKWIMTTLGGPQTFVLMPAGGISTSTSAAGTEGSAEIHVIVKGTNGMMDLVVLVEKQLGDKKWKVVSSK